MDNSELYNKIEDYLKHRLTEPEKMVFEQQIASDADLAATVNLHRKIMEASGEQDIIALRQKMRSLVEETRSDRQKDEERQIPTAIMTASVNRRRWIAVAAGLTLIIGAYYFLQPGVYSTPQELFAANYNSPMTISLIDRGSSQTDSLWLLSEGAYQNKNYVQAIKFLDAVLESKTNNEQELNEIYRATAVLCLNLQQGKEAESALLKISDQSGFESDKAWYLALALLLQPEKKEAARTAFNNFAAHPDFQKDKRQSAAKKIAKQLMTDN